MKKIISFGFVFLLLISSVLAYGGGVGLVMPPSIFSKVLDLQKNKVPTDIWLPAYFSAGSTTHKVDKEGLAVKAIDVSFSRRTGTNNGFQIVAHKDVKEGIVGFTIDTSVDKLENFMSADIYFEVPTDWAHEQDNIIVEKTHDGRLTEIIHNVELVSEKDGKSLYKINVKSFSDFIVMADNGFAAETSQPESSSDVINTESAIEIGISEPHEPQGDLTTKERIEAYEAEYGKTNYGFWFAVGISIVIVVFVVLYIKYNNKKTKEE